MQTPTPSRMILIAPPNLLRELPRRENHLLLPDLMKDLDYYSYYTNTRFQGRVILDNGAFEGVPWDRFRLTNLAIDVGATHIVLPDDVTGGDPHPLETFLEHFNTWPKGRFRYIYVIHGRTPHILAERGMEAIRHRKEAGLDFDLAISSLALRHVAENGPVPLDRNYVRPRALFELQMMFRDTYGPTELLPWVHLLGAVSFQEMSKCVEIMKGITGEVTFDTCDPVKEATTWSTRDPYIVGSPDAVLKRLKVSVGCWDVI